MVPFSFAGETFAATPDGALFWPAQNALLVAERAEAPACVADAVPAKASWLAAARHTAGMASFQANPLLFNL